MSTRAQSDGDSQSRILRRGFALVACVALVLGAIFPLASFSAEPTPARAASTTLLSASLPYESESLVRPSDSVYGVCMAGEVICSPNTPLQDTSARVTCKPDEKLVGFVNMFCEPSSSGLIGLDVVPGVEDLTNRVDVPSAGVSTDSEPMKWVTTTYLDGVNRLSEMLLTFVFNSLLGGESITPVVSCAESQGQTQANCQSEMPWFGQSFELIRTIGVYLTIPMFLLMVIHSIFTGNLQTLLKSALIMLPFAIIGTVFLISLTQLLLNISDDFVRYIGQKTLSATLVQCGGTNATTGQVVVDASTPQLYTQCMQNSTTAVALDKMGFMAVFIAPLIALSLVVIYIELVLRQLGVYIAVFFLPLAMAAAVWPAATKLAKMLVEILIGLIFSKVFIAAALAMGMAALAHMTTSNTTAAEVGGATADVATSLQNATNVNSSGGVHAAFIGMMILCTAAFVPTKVIMMTPTAITKQQGQMYAPQNLWAKGQALDAAINRGIGAAKTLSQNFKNRGKDNRTPRPREDTNTPPPSTGHQKRPPRPVSAAPPLPRSGARNANTTPKKPSLNLSNKPQEGMRVAGVPPRRSQASAESGKGSAASSSSAAAKRGPRNLAQTAQRAKSAAKGAPTKHALGRGKGMSATGKQKPATAPASTPKATPPPPLRKK